MNERLQEAYRPSCEEERAYLASYDITRWPRPSLTADVAVFAPNPEGALQLLLIRRGNFPYKGYWALPGGFLNMDESIEQAAMRELREETTLELDALIPIGIYSAVQRDPRGRVITAAYAALLKESAVAKACDDAAETRWFTAELSGDGECTLKLTSAGLTLSARLLRQSGAGCIRHTRLESRGLAFDHAEIIADAIYAIKALSDERLK